MSGQPWLKNYAPGVDWNAEIEQKAVYALLDDAVARFGDRPAIDFLDRIFTYKQLSTMVDRAARGSLTVPETFTTFTAPA